MGDRPSYTLFFVETTIFQYIVSSILLYEQYRAKHLLKKTQERRDRRIPRKRYRKIIRASCILANNYTKCIAKRFVERNEEKDTNLFFIFSRTRIYLRFALRRRFSLLALVCSPVELAVPDLLWLYRLFKKSSRSASL